LAFKRQYFFFNFYSLFSFTLSSNRGVFVSFMNTLLLVTDFYYQAKGREYYKEDVELSQFLRKEFRLWIAHIDDIDPLLSEVDVVLLRNTGPLHTHRDRLQSLKNKSLVLSNDLRGKGDLLGKEHLLTLFQSGFPVIPTVASLEDLSQMGNSERYLLKPMHGCDSDGVKILNLDELQRFDPRGFVIQPLVDFEYEVSFYFVDQDFHYALYAPDKTKRWKLEQFIPSQEDILFARRFIDWNTCRSGIQRVDACRLSDGSLALMELEDYNPYLSLSLLPKQDKEGFLEALCKSIKNQIKA
jgi:hypothetical protein